MSAPRRASHIGRRRAAQAAGWMLASMMSAWVAGCASGPPPPDWQLNARDGMARATRAYLSGDDGIEAVEFSRVRAEVARTGRADLLARAELVRCATRVASLVFDDCAGFVALARDAAPAERVYADYLAGRARPQDAALLPEQHRPWVGLATAPETVSAGGLAGMPDPLSRLVAAGVLLRSGRASPPVIALAVDTASAQGWRRPLLAWLNVQALRAESAGEADEAARLRRRIALVLDEPALVREQPGLPGARQPDGLPEVPATR